MWLGYTFMQMKKEKVSVIIFVTNKLIHMNCSCETWIFICISLSECVKEMYISDGHIFPLWHCAEAISV